MTPASKMANISSEVATGRRIKGREGFIALGQTIVDTRLAPGPAAALGTTLPLPTGTLSALVRFWRTFWRTRRLRRAGVGIDQFDLRAFAQLVRTVDDHQISRLDGALHLGVLAFYRADLDRCDRYGLILLDEEDEGRRSAALNSGRRNQRGVSLRFDRHAHVDELIRKENAVLIGKFCPEFDGARGRVDLIVEGQQASGRELVLAAAVVRLDSDFPTTLRALDDAGNVVLRHRIDHGHRLDLGDRDESVRVRRMDHVAWIHLPQAHAAADRRGDARVRELKL